MKFIYFLLVFCFSYGLSAQSLTGTNGLFKVPSAYVHSDGNAYVGASFLPKGYYELYNKGNDFTGMPTFITLSLYDRIEFMFRYTHQLGQVVSPETKYFPDRMFSLRYNVLKEDMIRPAVTLGLHDVSEALGGTTATPWFLATYLVASKRFELFSFEISSTIGYGHDLIEKNRNQIFNGFFGGVEIQPSILPFLSFVGEFDSEHINVAAKYFLFDHVQFGIGFMDMKALSGFVAYRFNLSAR